MTVSECQRHETHKESPESTIPGSVLIDQDVITLGSVGSGAGETIGRYIRRSLFNCSQVYLK